MKDLPNVTIIGTSSQGALLDILTKKLPNGWSLDLSDMRFYDKNMVSARAYLNCILRLLG